MKTILKLGQGEIDPEMLKASKVCFYVYALVDSEDSEIAEAAKALHKRWAPTLGDIDREKAKQEFTKEAAKKKRANDQGGR